MIKNSNFYEIDIKNERSFSVSLHKKNTLVAFTRILIILIITSFIVASLSDDYFLLGSFIGASVFYIQARKLYHLSMVIRMPTLVYENGELSSDGIVILERGEKLIAKVKTVNVIPSMGYSFEEYQVSMQTHGGVYRHLFSSSNEELVIDISKIIDSK